jgi:protein-L-isoaspartate(D-aspartate) O-methyltransferase
MIDFAQARRMMVEGQVRTSDVTDLALIDAMLAVPREHFVPAAQAGLAYLDLDLPVGGAPGHGSRRMLKPMVLAKLIQAAELEPGDVVLDVACATGYAAAVLARLAARVTALEDDAALAAAARRALFDLALSNVTVVTGPLTAGWPAGAPYDVILLEGATEIAPRSVFAQLRDGGRLLCVEGRNPGKAMMYRSVGGDITGRQVFDAAAPLLPGFAAPPAFVF